MLNNNFRAKISDGARFKNLIWRNGYFFRQKIYDMEWTLVKSSKIEVENNSVGKLLYGHSSSLKSDIRILVK